MAVWNPCANDLFLEALELAPDAREAFLEETCGTEPELKKQVKALLHARAHAGRFLETPVSEATLEEPLSALEGAMMGPYKLLEQIGEGGFGVVFLGEQSTPVRRKVALKLLKPGMDSAQVIARFEAERQALAMMDHPNIARVIDGGTTRTGRPYFVMELVKGVSITSYCDQHLLTLRQRLEIFISVCQAVHHAHQKGIIHRDLKPSNVLVTRQDDKSVVKVIDFGVAKALGEALTDKSISTGITQLIGTPQYMSPEQAGMGDLDVDTRSDIYSLGVLLYELLSGTPPFSEERFKEASYDEIRRIIREEDPPKPSLRLAEIQQTPAQTTEKRRIDSGKLIKHVQGELDWIVMKALDKDRNRRYETANSFAHDLQRYLNDQPVQACPPSWWYQCRKLARRNKGAVFAASVALVAVLAGMMGMTWGLLRAEKNWARAEKALGAETEARKAERRARDRAIAALQLMTEEVVQHRMTRDTKLHADDKAFLRKMIEHFEGFAALTPDDPESRALRAEGYAQVGVIQHRLGELKEAEAAINQAAQILKQLVEENPSRVEFRHDLGRSHNHLGMLHHATGKLDSAASQFAQALAIFSKLASDSPADSEIRIEQARTLTYQAMLFRDMGQLDQAESAYVQTAKLYQQLAPGLPDRPGVRMEWARSYNNLAVLFQETGRLQEAEKLFGQALAIQQQLAASYHARPDLLQELSGSHGNLGLLYRATGRLEEAHEAYTNALAIRKQLAADYAAVPEYRNDLASCHANLGLVYRARGQNKEAESEYGLALAIHQQLAADFPAQPKFSLHLARCRTRLGELYHGTKRMKEAEVEFSEALSLTKSLVAKFPDRPEYRQELAAGHNNLGAIHRVSGRLKKARAAYLEALTIQKQMAAEYPTQPDHQNIVAGTLGNLAHVCNLCDEFQTAKSHLDDALTYHRTALKNNPQHPDYRRAYRGYLLELVSTNACLNDQKGAVVAAESMRDLGWDPQVDAYDGASSLAVCVSIGKRHHLLDAVQRQAAVRFYSDQAMTMLRAAIAKGWRNAAQLRKDPDFDELRQQLAFQQLLRELERSEQQH